MRGEARRRPARLDCLASFLRLVLVLFPCGIAVLIVGEGCRERSGRDSCQEYCEDHAFHGPVPFPYDCACRGPERTVGVSVSAGHDSEDCAGQR